MTFDESLQQLIGYLRKQDRSEVTIKHYYHDLQQFARWFEQTNGRQPALKTITSMDVREYRSYMQNTKGYKPTTINRRLQALRVLCHWAVEVGHIATDPTTGIKGVGQQQLGPKALDRTEIHHLVQALEERLQWVLSTKGPLSKAALKATRDMAIAVLLLHTGLRISELVGLRLSDVEMSERKGSLNVRGKGNKQRKVPLNVDVRKALRQWLEVRPDIESEALFLGRNSAPLSVRGVQKVVADLAKRAQVKGSASSCPAAYFRHPLPGSQPGRPGGAGRHPGARVAGDAAHLHCAQQ